MEKTLFQKTKEFFGFQEEETYEETNSMLDTKPVSTTKKDPMLKPFKGNIVNAQKTKSFSPSEIKIEEPRIYEDSLNIATQLRESKPVIVNLKYLDSLSSKRLIDFICGTAYAINGHMMKIGENIFLFTPPNMLIVNSEEKTTFEQGVQEEEKQTFFQHVG
jgi:cell division inhibitor SepF